MAVWILEMVEPEGARSRISRSLLVSRLGHRAGGATAGARAHAGRLPGGRLPRTRRGLPAASRAAAGTPAFRFALGGAGAEIAGIRHRRSADVLVVVAHSHTVVEIVLHDRLAVN